MKKVIIISLFVLGLIIPNINVKAVDVSNEEELRAAIEQGGDITLTDDIEVTQPLVIDKDVNIDGDWNYILMQGDNTLMTINGGNVTLYGGIHLCAGWNGGDYKFGARALKDQGTALVVNGGTVNLDSASINAGKLGLEVNDGTVELVDSAYISSEKTALVVNNSGKVNLNLFTDFDPDSVHNNITSYEGNGIEVNNGGIVNIKNTFIHSTKSAIYLNGGTVSLDDQVALRYSNYAIYINKGKNSVSNDSSLFLEKNLILVYGNFMYAGNFEMPSIYINPEVAEVKVTDKNNFSHYENNKLKLNFCSNNASASNTDSEEGTDICTNIGGYYDGPIYTNELGKCTVVYVNGVKQNEENSSCNPVADNKNEPSQIVNVPATSAYASIIIITLGILCVIVSVIVTRRVTKKAKSN